jgi:hypothetical protein
MELCLLSTIPVAQYLRLSNEHQQYLLGFKLSTMKSDAEWNNFTIVQTYADPGKSGFALRNQRSRKSCLSISWLVDSFTRPSSSLTLAVGEDFKTPTKRRITNFSVGGKESLSTTARRCFRMMARCLEIIMKSLKRIMAAEFSRELSEKVTLAMNRMVPGRLLAGFYARIRSPQIVGVT